MTNARRSPTETPPPLRHRVGALEGCIGSIREREVPRLVAKGLTNREIAEQLVIAESTARNPVSRIFERLGLSRRSEAAAFAVQRGVMEPER